MESACPICGQELEVHADLQMAECGLALMQRDYGYSCTEDFVWMCPGCDNKMDDHDDGMLARCSRTLVPGDYGNGAYAG